MSNYLFIMLLTTSCSPSLDLSGWKRDFLSSNYSYLENIYLEAISDSNNYIEDPERFIFYKNGTVASTRTLDKSWPFPYDGRLTESVNDIGQYFVKNDTIYIQTVIIIGAYGQSRVVAKYKIVKENNEFRLIYYWLNNKSPVKELHRVFEENIELNPIIYQRKDLDSFPDINSWYFDGDWGKVKSE